MNLLAFGEVLWDVFPDNAYIGGAPLNFAAHAAKHGAKAYLLSAVGDDALGVKTRETVQAMQVDTTYLSTVAAPTGRCVVTLNEADLPSYDLKKDVAWDRIDDAVTEPFDVLYCGTLALRCEHNRRSLEKLIAANRFTEIFTDLNLRAPFYSAEALNLVLRHATIVKISDEELPTVLALLGMTGENLETAAQQIAAHFPNICLLLITKGGDGSLVYRTADERFWYDAATPAAVVSTVGAGDSFAAAFLCRYLAGESIDACLQHASKVAAFVVSHVEAVPYYNIK